MHLREKELEKNLNYIWYALYAFGALGLEFVLIGFLEPILFGGIGMPDYSSTQHVIHWLLTMFCWGSMAWVLVRSSQRKLGFSVFNNNKPQWRETVIGITLMIPCIFINILDCGTLKSIAEFHSNGIVLFIFQYLYYLFEIFLVLLIVIFGQKFFDIWFCKACKFPWGGVVLGCTWGAVHILSKGSIATGMAVMVFSLLYGTIYISFNRNTKCAYMGLAIAFML